MFNDSILLPIKPVYVKRILDGSKKFEFRKKLCKRDIQKIYIYSTAPVKKVVGEVQVLSKVEGEKEELWKKVHDSAGVSYEEYISYFSSGECASAYQLGKVTIYKQPKDLSEFDINYYPQSYVYL